MTRKKAVAGTTATYNELRLESYPQAGSASSLKSEIGTLLLCLQFPIGRELSGAGWRLFERLLRRYVEVRLLSQSEPETSQATILSQRVSE